jgi:hypothetical protein
MAVTVRRQDAVALPGLPGLAGLPWVRREREVDRRAPGATRTRPGAARPAAGRRVRANDRVRARRRGADRAALLLAGIAIVFTGAFVSLSQSVAANAAGYDIVRLQAERDRLDAQRRDLESTVSRYAAAPAIRKGAIDAGLGQLGAAEIVPAR